MFSFLSKPYPAPDSYDYRTAISKALVAGTIVSLVLILFEPFGLDRIGFSNKYLVYIGYGLVTLFTILLIEIVLVRLFPKVFKENTWIVRKEIVFQLVMLLSVGLFNGVFNSLSSGASYNLSAVGGMMVNTAIVGICPLTVLVIADYFRLATKFTEQSTRIENTLNSTLKADKQIEPSIAPFTIESEKIILKGKNEGEFLQLLPEELLFVGSQANYVTIIHLREGAITKTIFRTTLSNIEQAVQGHKGILKCHRGGIVNLNHVEKSSGNAQGLKLQLREYTESISVSRNYVRIVRKYFEEK